MALVSIIMPVYNIAPFLDQAIRSVIAQTHENWELLVINDGSTDESETIIRHFTEQDERIVLLSQCNKGVSTARNVGLNSMRGDFFCFLDGDDWMPRRSVEWRLAKFSESALIGFVDGTVEIYDEAGERIERIWKPSFTGYPKRELLRLSEECFFGLTWMFKRQDGEVSMFRQDLTHGEDLMFNIDNAAGKRIYAFVTDPVYCYRNRSGSAMKDFRSLISGYKALYLKFSEHDEFDFWSRQIYLYKTRKISLLLFLRFGRFRKVFRQLFPRA